MKLPATLKTGWRIFQGTVRAFAQDNGFFLAMGLAFNLLLYAIPLALLMISLLGYTVLDSDQAIAEVQKLVRQLLPGSQQALSENLTVIAANRGLLGVAGALSFILFSSTLFGSIRYVLNIVFKAKRTRGFLRGVAQDFLVMLLSASLLACTIGLASLLAFVPTFQDSVPSLVPLLKPVWIVVSKMLVLAFTIGLFYLQYRFAPARTLDTRALLLGAISGAALFTLARWGFAWYVALARESIALYGALGGFMFLIFWLYYACAAFVLGAEAGAAYDTLYGASPEEKSQIASSMPS